MKLGGQSLSRSISKLRQPTGQRLSNVRKQQTKIAIRPILFLYYEESLISSNVNSKQLRFDGAHPNLHVIRTERLLETSEYYIRYTK